LNQKHGQRFQELESEIKEIISNKYRSRDIECIKEEDFIEWKVKAKNLLVKSCGEDSEHYKEFLINEKRGAYGTSLGAAKRLMPVFKAAKSDFYGGYLSSVRILVQAEIFESELEQAKELLKSGYKTASAVIAGIVLETGLRELCDTNTIDHGKLDKMNADLAKAGIYGKLEQKRITTLANIRNSAAHGNPDEFTADDVSDMIRDVERFLANHLG
jgi:hypothetical protein